jgi:hypothetical protein
MSSLKPNEPLSPNDIIRLAAESDLEPAKFCHKCSTLKPLGSFAKNKARKDGVGTQCKECMKAWYKQHYERNKDEIMLKTNAYRRNNKHIALKTQRKWQAANRDKTSFYNAERRAKQKMADLILTEEQKQQIKDIYWLARDVSLTTGEPYEVDHIVPISGKNVCGLHVPWNLQILPKDLNIKKSNKLANS